MFAGAIKLGTGNDRAYFGHAETLWQRGDREEAVEEMEKALLLSGNDPRVAVRLGRMYLDLDRVEDASRLCDEALRADRLSADAWALRGDCLARDPASAEDALAAYHRAMAIQPECPDVQVAAADLYGRLGRYQRLLATLDRLHDSMPIDGEPLKAHLLRGIAFQKLDRPTEAYESFLVAARSFPENPEPQQHLARLELQQCQQLGSQRGQATLAGVWDRLQRLQHSAPGDPFTIQLREGYFQLQSQWSQDTPVSKGPAVARLSDP